MFLSAIRRRPEHTRDRQCFPWSIPLIAGLEDLTFTAPVTFLVGENGSGKSTLLEGLAVGMGAVAAGRNDLARDPTLEAAREFAQGFVFVRRRHARTRMFLRAEDVFGFTQRITDGMAGLAADAADLAAAIPEGYGRTIAVGAVQGQRRSFAADYGENPDGKSHGETFLAVLRRRLVPNGLYFLDEPETPLSPTRVLALIAIIAQAVERGCQFVIATHSPILMAFPGAAILLANEGTLHSADWDDIEHVRVTRAFLADPATMLRKVLP